MLKVLSTSVSSQPDSQHEIFIKEGTPYEQTGRYYLGLQQSCTGICAIKLQDGAPISFVSHCSITEVDFDRECLKRASHPNLLNLKEIFVNTGSFFFVYDQWGMTLGELWQLTPVFQLGEIEVATICNGILQGLKYIHSDLGICHGNLTCSTVLVSDEGHVKITGIGESMLRKHAQQGKSEDIKAICGIARTLLGLDNGGGVRGTIGLLAEDFTSASSDKKVEDLLQVSSKVSSHSIMFPANDKLPSTHSFGNARPHSAYAPSISFVPSLKHSPLHIKSEYTQNTDFYDNSLYSNHVYFPSKGSTHPEISS